MLVNSQLPSPNSQTAQLPDARLPDARLPGPTPNCVSELNARGFRFGWLECRVGGWELSEEQRHLLRRRLLDSTFDNQLAARRADVPAAALADRHGDVTVRKNLGEPVDAFV